MQKRQENPFIFDPIYCQKYTYIPILRINTICIILYEYILHHNVIYLYIIYVRREL